MIPLLIYALSTLISSALRVVNVPTPLLIYALSIYALSKLISSALRVVNVPTPEIKISSAPIPPATSN